MRHSRVKNHTSHEVSSDELWVTLLIVFVGAISQMVPGKDRLQDGAEHIALAENDATHDREGSQRAPLLVTTSFGAGNEPQLHLAWNSHQKTWSGLELCEKDFFQSLLAQTLKWMGQEPGQSIDRIVVDAPPQTPLCMYAHISVMRQGLAEQNQNTVPGLELIVKEIKK